MGGLAQWLRNEWHHGFERRLASVRDSVRSLPEDTHSVTPPADLSEDARCFAEEAAAAGWEVRYTPHSVVVSYSLLKVSLGPKKCRKCGEEPR